MGPSIAGLLCRLQLTYVRLRKSPLVSANIPVSGTGFFRGKIFASFG
jgi:hypothetical protein